MTPQQPGRDPLDVGPGGPVSRALARVVRLHRWAAGVGRQADLINALGLDPSTVTKMLQRLQRAGKVTRTTDPADRRAVLVEATESSRALRPEIEAAQKTLEERTVARLDPAELHRLLEKVAAHLRLQNGPCP